MTLALGSFDHVEGLGEDPVVQIIHVVIPLRDFPRPDVIDLDDKVRAIVLSRIPA